MASYKSFEDLPVWNAAVQLAADIFNTTQHTAFKYRGDLVNQIRRSALSISNNIAEGFERGTTSDLINFLYIARGSCGETRSMLLFAPRLGGMEQVQPILDQLAERCRSVSRQLHGWIDSLKNSSISGDRNLNDRTRVAYVKDGFEAEFREKFNPAMREKAYREGRFQEYLLAEHEARLAIREAADNATAHSATPSCPKCGKRMAKRHDRNGRAFWGCTAYPDCKGTLDCNV